MDLRETILQQLSAPVRKKGTQEYMTNEQGELVKTVDGIAMTIVGKALAGDLAAATFCLNLQMQQQRDPNTEAEEADRRKAQTEKCREEIKAVLESEGLWADSLMLDVEELAQQKAYIGRLTEQMEAPGYQDVFAVPKKDGTVMPAPNPLQQLRESAVDRFQKGMERLRNEAVKRKLQARQFK